MIAIIRVHENGSTRQLCELDLDKFSEEQVRERMAERGIEDDAFFICGFSDWDVDRILSLEEACRIKRYIQNFYLGDDDVIKYLLQSGRPINEIFTCYYEYISKDELTTMQRLLPEADSSRLLAAFCGAGTWANFMQAYVQAGHVLVTPKGYYIKEFEV